MDLNPEEYYYPINTKDSNEIFNKYKSLAKNIKKTFLFVVELDFSSILI